MARNPTHRSSNDPTLQKLPPHSIEAEESILSAILLDNSTLLDVLEILSADHFYRTAHQKIFAAISELFSKSEPVDLVTVASMLRDQNQLEEIGGAAFLSRIVDTVPSAINVQHYARIVRDKSSLRRLIAKANEITQHCYTDGGDLDQVLDFAEGAVFEISEDKHQAAFHPISKIIEANIDALEVRQGNRALVTGVPTGFTQLDHKTSGFQGSDLIILAARPSMGKTALALNIARNAAEGLRSSASIRWSNCRRQAPGCPPPRR